MWAARFLAGEVVWGSMWNSRRSPSSVPRSWPRSAGQGYGWHGGGDLGPQVHREISGRPVFQGWLIRDRVHGLLHPAGN